MKTILTLLSIHITCFCFGQLPSKPNEKINFKEVQPLWYETSYHPDLVSDKSDGYNVLNYWYACKKIFDGNDVYSILATHVGINSWGAYLEKRNIETGELLWQTKYHTNDLQYQEILENWYLSDEGDELVVLGIRRIEEKTETNGSFCIYEDSARVTYRVYDTKDGRLKEYINPPNSDTTVANIIASDLGLNLPIPNIFRTSDPDVYRYTQNRTRAADGSTIPNHQLRTFYIDKYGHPLTPEDTIVLGDPQIIHNIVQLSPDTLIYLEQDYATGQKLKIHFYDIDFNKLNSIDLDSLPFPRGLVFLFQVKKDRFLVVDYSPYPGPDIKELFTMRLYDDHGKVLDYYRFDDFNDGYLGSAIEYLEKINKLVFFGTQWYGDHTKLEIIASDGQGGKETLMVLQSDDLNKMFWAKSINELEGDKIIISMSERLLIKENFQIVFDNYARAQSTMVFNASDLGLSTVGVDDVSVRRQVTILPNPVNDKLFIDLKDRFDGDIAIYDQMGRLMLKRLVSNISTIDIDVSHLTSGVYFVRIKSKQSKEVYETKKFVKS